MVLLDARIASLTCGRLALFVAGLVVGRGCRRLGLATQGRPDFASCVSDRSLRQLVRLPLLDRAGGVNGRRSDGRQAGKMDVRIEERTGDDTLKAGAVNP